MHVSNSGGTVTRRGFLGASMAAGASFSILPGHVLGLNGQTPPSELLNVALIGAGGRGTSNISELHDRGLAKIVALCDVDDERAAEMYARFPDVPKYRDFRTMLDKEKGIEAVVVATPDHMHAIASLAAIQLGKHVYCEKPLTHTVHEARVLAKAAREKGVATQMGNQGMAFEGNRLITEWLQAGAIGAVREVYAWSDRPTHYGKLMWAQGMERPTDTPPVPATLDWDLWLGPAPERLYHPAYMPFVWRGWWDYGSGGLGDMGIHNLAPVFSSLQLGAPESVDASSTLFNDASLPLATMVHYRFPARGDMPAVDVHWYDGGNLPPRPEELEPGEELDPEDGLILVGDKGKMLVEGWGGERPRLLPKSRMDAYLQPPQTLPRSIGHHAEWVEACKGGAPARSNFDVAGPLTEAVLLGMVAVRARRHLTWDSASLTVTNSPEANAYVTKQYRKGWELGQVG
ncbi:MAG: Gfo/Idh/MocA family oxidoreductase [Candidatus Hydrogenedentes bacterium]|nr:Gfo/Idh/MocA family oxidoreductase [Candidatus Hydrogenedentota bacterium]